MSLFWVAWGFVAEKAENFKLADQIYQKGIKRLAEPKDVLQKRYHQFQRRMARHFLNQAEAAALNEAAGPVIAEPGRQVLGQLSKSQAVSSVPRVPSTAPIAQTVNGVSVLQPRGGGLTQSRPLSASSTAAQASLSGRSSNAAPSFTILADNPAKLADDLSSLPENANWKSVPLASTLSKENQSKLYMYSYCNYFLSQLILLLLTHYHFAEPMTKWSEGPLVAPTSATRPTGGLSNRLAVTPGSAVGNATSNNISIFVDPDLISNQENELTLSNQKPPKKQGTQTNGNEIN